MIFFNTFSNLLNNSMTSRIWKHAGSIFRIILFYRDEKKDLLDKRDKEQFFCYVLNLDVNKKK